MAHRARLPSRRMPLHPNDAVTQRNKDKGSMSFFADIGLFMIDEVHILGD
jgi:hypothetical protein